MDTACHIRRPGTQCFENIQLAAAVRVAPARAAAVFLRPGDEGVEEPDGGHVTRACTWHGEFEQKHLLRAAKAVVCRDAWAIVATPCAVLAAAGRAGEKDNFVVVEEDVGEGLRGGSCCCARGGSVRKGGAKVGGPDAGGAGAGTAAHVVEEDNVVGCTGGGGVVGLLGPGCAGGGW